MNKIEEILKQAKDGNVEFIRLQFTDILGNMKNQNITISQLESALNNEKSFDGSSIDGFARIEESDMYLYPDLDTFKILPKCLSGDVVEARILCDIYTTDGKQFEGDPRYILKKSLKEAKKLGYEMMVGPELEFFLFPLDENGYPKLKINDTASYYDLSTRDKGHVIKRDMCLALGEMGIEVESAIHECAPGQHEINFKYSDALHSADNILTYKFVVKEIAYQHGYYATFMPKPIKDMAGSGMHMNLSLFKDNENVFEDASAELGLSIEAYQFIAGIMKHAKGLTAITNRTINSYKRLVPGHEAPTYITWAAKNRSPMIRIPSAEGKRTRIEMRNPDPTCNPYLALAAILAAGLEGMKNKSTPPECMDCNIYELSESEIKKKNIELLPENLNEALKYLLEDELIRKTLGSHVINCMKNIIRTEWDNYRTEISLYELTQTFGENIKIVRN